MKSILFCLLLTISCSKTRSFKTAELGQTLTEAEQAWGKPDEVSTMDNQTICTWLNNEKYSISLWFENGKEGAVKISISRGEGNFSINDRWSYVESITNIEKSSWLKKGVIENESIIYTNKGYDLLIQESPNQGVLILKNNEHDKIL